MKKTKKYLKLETFFENGQTRFGWKVIPANRKRSPKSVLSGDVFVKSYNASTGEEIFMSDSDVERYIIYSIGMSAKELYSSWNSRPLEFEEVYKTTTLSYGDGDGKFFLHLSNLSLNDISFKHGEKEFSKVSYA